MKTYEGGKLHGKLISHQGLQSYVGIGIFSDESLALVAQLGSMSEKSGLTQ
jgi:hypothetical protein